MSNPYLPNSPSSSNTNQFYNPYSSSSSSLPSSSNARYDQPITRSRTLFYLSVRDSSTTYSSRVRKSNRQYGDTVDIGDDEEQIGLMGSSSGGKGLPPRWVDMSDEVDEILSRAKTKISSLDKLHAKHVLPGFTDRTAEEREIERQTADITRDFRRCTSLISSVNPGPRAQRVEIMTAKNVQRGLAQKVQELSGVFRKKQRVYMQKLQGQAIKNKDLMVASGAITLRGTDLLDELEEDEQATQNQLQSQSQSTSAIDIDIQQRTNEITQIASSISELADLFRDLGNLVVEQGTVLDSVEYNVQMTARELKGAEEELKVAQRYQANTGRRKCILFLVLCIIGLIIILIYKPRSHSSTPIPTESSLPVELPLSSSIIDDYLDIGTSMEITPSYKSVLYATPTTTEETPSSRPHRPMPKPPPLFTPVDEVADW
ncbi:hypothetical protein I302_109147 [Kwoniella bestiolae CBS 10118]|uniref:Syntaxin 16 n=1 Tax=Kwoniella bestiolae CBS 10118 TaxID=1296100 RepID=A0A1B9FV47_9TREE|nr:syntaxin 16 [Kwoniella bestiolae CBS 10118]OCF22642.1 syntaxin 16 [Kwoniella bestiolae CBS 10118]